MARQSADVHVYNRHAALTVTPCLDRAGTLHTVLFEAARRLDGSDHYDWDAKLTLQVTASEIGDVLAVLYGWQSGCSFRFHGAGRNAGYELQHVEERLRCAVFSAHAGRIEVSLSNPDRLAVAIALFRQFQRNHGGLPAEVLFESLRAIYASPTP